MKAVDLRPLTYKELREKLDEATEELFNLRFQAVTNQLDNSARLGQVRREIARIKTMMRRQEIEAWESQQEEA